MYRLLKLRRLYTFNSSTLSSSCFSQRTEQKCSICKHNLSLEPHNGFQYQGNVASLRFQSTSIHTAVQNSAKTKKKKIKKSRKKYAELLEVTNKSSNQTKASVSTLKPKHLSLLVEQPDINLGQLFHLKKAKVKQLGSVEKENRTSLPEHERVLFNNSDSVGEIVMCNQDDKLSSADEVDVLCDNNSDLLQDSDVFNAYENDIDGSDVKPKFMEEYDSAALEEQQMLSRSAEVEHSEYDEVADDRMTYLAMDTQSKEKKIKKKSKRPSYKPKSITQQREEVAKIKYTELEKLAKEESLYRNLLSYLEVCVSCGLLNRALYSLLYFYSRSKHSRYLTPPNEIKLFNVVLLGFAQKGNLAKVKEVLEILKKNQIPLSPVSYAAIIECVGRLPHTEDNHKFLEEYVQKMSNQGLTFNDVMQNTVFILDQQDVMLSTIKRIDPSFVYNHPKPHICYSCHLLEELNSGKLGKTDAGYKSPGKGICSRAELRKLTGQQFMSELKCRVEVKTIEKRAEESTENIIYYREKLKETQENWRKVINKAFHRDLRNLRSLFYRSFTHVNLYPYLKVLDINDYIEIIMQEVRRLAEGSETYSPTTHYLYRELGNQVRSRYEVKYKTETGILKKVEHLYDHYCDWYLNAENSSSNITNTRIKWQHLEYENPEGPSVNLEEKSWPLGVLVCIGKFLYNIIMRDIKIDINIPKANMKTEHQLPAFYTLFRSQGRITKEEVKPHPVLARLFREAAQENLVFDVNTVPMLCPPLPWSSVTTGGYLLAKTELIRLPFQAAQQWHILKNVPVQQLYPCLDSLNQLASIPWTVNEPILDVVIEVFNSGGSHRLDIPEPPSSCPSPTTVTPEMTKAEKFQAYRQRMALRRQKAEMYSLRCDALYRLSLANNFRKRVFWLPHNMDFRGRVYPCPPHLNHLGSDMARSLLCFAKGEPLGNKGLDWLKIHMVNLTGLKKKDSLVERLQYAEEMMPEIMDSAENPLNGRMWWATSEEPWQTLACCMEIVKAIKSGDPENYVCHFPVHQDGSCNGLQHYAALGRDKAGAESVNLYPSSQPQDVYSRVATLVERERSKDDAAGLKIAQVLEGFVKRKVIKQTVMTTVYGVTRFGARLQIARQLKDIENFPKEFVWQASSYLTLKTFDSLQEMFTSTKEIQDWFTDCARLISQVCGQNVEWVTPLGFHVVQPYCRYNKQLDIKPSVTRIKDQYLLDMYERPNTMKQKNAFPPNFIHSLDSSHMMLTSLFSERAGITFVSVHDCFWTHPSSIDVMNKICREQFVALHSENILEDLSTFLAHKYSYSESEFQNDGSVIDMKKRRLNRIFNKLPQRGDFDLKSVLESVYFFS